MVRITTAAVAATVLAALPAVLAVPEPNTVKYTYERRRVNAQDVTPSMLKRQSNTVNVQLSNEYLLYIINVTVGTPGQPIALQIDTGSSDIWFPSSNTRICQTSGYCVGGSYNARSSSTYSSTNYPEFEIAYVDGSQVVGQYITDVLNIGSTQLTNLTMAAATQLDRDLGIMGIGFRSGESSNSGSSAFTYPNIINVLQQQGHINTLSYSLWLDDLNANTGSILFGGVDSDKYMGSLVALPIQRDSQSGQYTSFTVAWTGLEITGSGNTANLSPSTPQPAILDSGTSLLYLPDDIANSIFNGVGVTSDNNYGNVVPCNLRNDNLTFTFTFGGSNGARISVPLAEFVVPFITTDGSTPKFRNGQEACQFGIEAAGSNPILFGDTFLRSAYVVYDLDNLEIGLAQTNFGANSGTGNVRAFTSGSGIPDATTTATGASVAQTFNGRPDLITTTNTVVGATAGAAGTSRSATFKLSSGTSGGTTATGTGSGSSNAASHFGGDRSVLAVLAVTAGAFWFGFMMI